MMRMSLEQEILAVAQKARAFATQYYKALDSEMPEERLQSMTSLYVPQSVISWNGHSSATDPLGFLEQMFAQMPQTTHTLVTLDAHPLPGSDGKGDAFIINITGKVSYNNEAAKLFFQTMVVRQAPGDSKHYLVHDEFRWLAER